MYEELIKSLRSIDEYDTGYAKLIYDAADAIEEEDMAFRHLERDYKELCAHLPKWIPVTERLPEIYQRVLVIGRNGKAVYTGIYNGGMKATERRGAKPNKIITGEYGWRTFTFWMPLPEPPKEE